MKLLTGILVVALLAFSSVSAQTSPEETILADGGENLTQAMVNRLVDFFEWSLEVRLSEAQRAEFQREVVENWKNDNYLEVEGVLFVLEFMQEIEHWDEAKRRAAQILIKERFLKEFARNKTNKINAVLLGSYRQKHSEIDGVAAAKQ